ncbi:hypothetical protein D3C85_1338540 [compost metagenome]
MTANHRDYLVIDEFGIDPLLDKSYDAITAVRSFTYHTIEPSEHHNPALISFNMWRTTAWWRVVMVYNNIDDLWDVVEGLRIKIPDVNELTTRLQKIKAVVVERTVVI